LICFQKVLHEIDATKLEEHFAHEYFDAVFFNFPHVGEQRVHLNRCLIKAFLQSAQFISARIFVTLKNIPRYSSGMEDMGIQLERKFLFDVKHFKPYQHVTTQKNAKHLTGGESNSMTWMFRSEVTKKTKETSKEQVDDAFMPWLNSGFVL